MGALVLVLILVVLLCKECGEKQPALTLEQTRHRKSYARKVSQKNRQSALFVKNAGSMLDKMDKMQGRVRTLSAAQSLRSSERVRGKKKPKFDPLCLATVEQFERQLSEEAGEPKLSINANGETVLMV